MFKLPEAPGEAIEATAMLELSVLSEDGIILTRLASGAAAVFAGLMDELDLVDTRIGGVLGLLVPSLLRFVEEILGFETV